MNEPTTTSYASMDWRELNERRDRAEERVRQLRDMLADALTEYGKADQAMYRLRQLERGRHFRV